MIGFKFKPKLVQFNRSAITRGYRDIVESPMKAAGMMVRQAARSRLRTAKHGKGTKKDITGQKTFLRPSRAPAPPKSRAKDHPMRRIYSVPTKMGTGAMVGPVGFEAQSNGMPVTQLHEEGGQVKRSVYVESASGQGARDSRGKFLKHKRHRKYVNKLVTYPARRYMRPALERVTRSKKFVRLFENDRVLTRSYADTMSSPLPPIWQGSLTG